MCTIVLPRKSGRGGRNRRTDVSPVLVENISEVTDKEKPVPPEKFETVATRNSKSEFGLWPPTQSRQTSGWRRQGETWRKILVRGRQANERHARYTGFKNRPRLPLFETNNSRLHLRRESSRQLTPVENCLIPLFLGPSTLLIVSIL